MNKKYKISLILLILLVAVGFWFFTNSESDPEPDNTQTTEVDIAQEPVAEDIVATTDPVPETQEEQQDQNTKQSNPPTPSSEEAPRINTGNGHTEAAPLGLDVQTSTSCTVTPDSECFIQFTNADTNEQKFFETKTANSQGITVWSWKGSDIGAGTWILNGVSGDKSSQNETIYIGN